MKESFRIRVMLRIRSKKKGSAEARVAEEVIEQRAVVGSRESVTKN
jgi:hypothetical protein